MGEFIRNVLQATRSFFNGGTVILWYVFYAVISGGYFYVISLHATLSIFVGMAIAFPLFYALNVMSEQRAHRSKELHALSKYEQMLVFNLKVGKNIHDAYEAILPHVDVMLHKDIKRTMDILRFDGHLDITHFKRYNFQTLDLFHNNLQIKATRGGKAAEIFKNATKDLTRELSKRDELARNKTFITLETYLMIGMVMVVPVILSYTAEIVYIPFVESAIGKPFLMLYMAAIYALIYFLSRSRMDVDVKL